MGTAIGSKLGIGPIAGQIAIGAIIHSILCGRFSTRGAAIVDKIGSMAKAC